MHILIDARMIGGKPHGIAVHTRQLVENLRKTDKKNRYSLLVRDVMSDPSHSEGQSPDESQSRFIGLRFAWLRLRNDTSIYVTQSPWISLSEQFELPYLLKKIKPDLFHSPSFVIPFYCPVPFVLTLHDLNHVRCPGMKRFHTTLYYQTILQRAVHRAKKIITVSNFSKDEIINYYNVPSQKISVVYNGVDPTFSPVRDEKKIETCKKKYRLPDRFVLWIGNAKKHKNLDRTMEAYEKLKTDVSLVVVGSHSERDDDKMSNPKIYFRERIDEGDLVCLYQLSEFLVCVSLYEGFGLPVAEALACGKRVIISNRPPLSEIVGNAGIPVDPTDVDAIAKAMAVALNDPHGNEVHQAGIDQAKKFSWEEAARQTMEIYESCYRS